MGFFTFVLTGQPQHKDFQSLDAIAQTSQLSTLCVCVCSGVVFLLGVDGIRTGLPSNLKWVRYFKPLMQL